MEYLIYHMSSCSSVHASTHRLLYSVDLPYCDFVPLAGDEVTAACVTLPSFLWGAQVVVRRPLLQCSSQASMTSADVCTTLAASLHVRS